MSHSLVIDANTTPNVTATAAPAEDPAGSHDAASDAVANRASAVEHAEPPRILDTYALLYAMTLVFLVPSVASIVRLPFRDYTFAYTTLVALPGFIGMLAVLLTDSRDSLRTVLVRIAVLSPLIALTGVTVLFTSSFIVLPLGQILTPKGFDIAGPFATVMLIVLALPLLPALVRRLRLPLGWRSVVHIVALLFGIAVVAIAVALTLRNDRTLATFERKDATIYMIGALVWYLPSFGISAGVWRRLGLV